MRENHLESPASGTVPPRAGPRNEQERPERFLNRALSLLAFHRRLLEEAQDARHPLLERITFLAMFASAIDDFYALRIATLKRQQERSGERSPTGLPIPIRLDVLHQHLELLLAKQDRVATEQLFPALARAGIELLAYDQLDEMQRRYVAGHFHRNIFPVLTPMGVDAGHPFPHISHQSLNLAVILRTPRDHERFARLKIPLTLPRLVHVPLAAQQKTVQAASTAADAGTISPLFPGVLEGSPPFRPAHSFVARRVAFVWLEQVVTAHLERLFSGMQVVQAFPFRVLREAPLAREEGEEAERDAGAQGLQGLRERRFGAPVHLSVDPSMPEQVRALLLEHLELGAQDAVVRNGPLGLGDVIELVSLDRPDLKETPHLPQGVPAVTARRAPHGCHCQE